MIKNTSKIIAMLVFIEVNEVFLLTPSLDFEKKIQSTENMWSRPSGYNPCAKYDPPKPDFVTGYRISESKCLEYIWDLKLRKDLQDRQRQCRGNTCCPNCTQLKTLNPEPSLYFPSIGTYIKSTYHFNAELMLVNRDRIIHFPDDVNAYGVVGGRESKIGEFPHMGAVGWRLTKGTWLFLCGSSLISHKFALTAAHCSHTSPDDERVSNIFPEIVRLGVRDIEGKIINDNNPVDAPILKFTKHPNYVFPKKYFDIALIEFVDAVKFTETIQPACLWASYDTSNLGTEATLTGWGVSDLVYRKVTPNLQVAVVDIINSSLCNELLGNFCNIKWCGTRDQICAGKLQGGVDSCQGDSGGPLQVEIPLRFSTKTKMHFLLGVTSFGMSCARPNLPAIYTRVSSFIDWIESIVWQ